MNRLKKKINFCWIHKAEEDKGQTAASKTGEKGKYGEVPLARADAQEQKLPQEPVAVWESLSHN